MKQHTDEQLSTATMFISFDLVNCTKYKSTHKGAWATGINDILEYAIHVFSDTHIDGFRFWKIIGDEIAYTKNIEHIHEIDDILKLIYNTVVNMNQKIETAVIGDEETAKYITVKATVWIGDISPTHNRADNFYIEYKINENQLQAEYLGTDIDTGFRIAQFTSSNRVVISAQLAALFYKEPELQKDFHKIHFVSSRTLKGIWDNKPYPIFMYHGDSEVSFYDSITDTSNPKKEVLQEYLKDYPNRLVNPPFARYEEQFLDELCQNTTFYTEVEQLMRIIAYKNDVLPIAPLPRLQVYYGAVCYTIQNGEIRFMIANDALDFFAFGGAPMYHNMQFLETIQHHYQKTFALEIKIQNDTRYHDPIPLILATETSIEGMPCTLFLAEIKGDPLAKSKQSAYKFYTLSEISSLFSQKDMTFIIKMLKFALTNIAK